MPRAAKAAAIAAAVEMTAAGATEAATYRAKLKLLAGIGGPSASAAARPDGPARCRLPSRAAPPFAAPDKAALPSRPAAL